MKVLFVQPNLRGEVAFNYGVAFLSAVLKRAGHETAFFNVNDRPSRQAAAGFIESVKRESPGLVGFSVMTSQYPCAVEAAEWLRRELPGVPVIVGGVHATADPRGCLESGAFDYACVGEGEEALIELVTAMETGADTVSIPGIWASRDGDIIPNPERPLTSLESLPPKDYTVFDFQQMIDARDGWVGVMASRGGVREADDLAHVRRHSVASVIDEIAFLLANYRNIRMFVFEDDVFAYDKEYVREFCERYAKVTDVPFICGAHVNSIDDELVEILRDGGCRIIAFTVDSGSARVRRDVTGRRMTNEQIEKAFAAVNAAGLHSGALVMIGLPGETATELDETVELLARIRPGRFHWGLFHPFPNTCTCDTAYEMDLIDFEKTRGMRNFTDDSCLDFGPEQNLKIRKLQTVLSWYVNALSDDPVVGRLFSRLTEVVDGLDRGAFEPFRPQVASLDSLLSQVVTKAGHELYSLRYNPFTAVTTKWND